MINSEIQNEKEDLIVKNSSLLLRLGLAYVELERVVDNNKSKKRSEKSEGNNSSKSDLSCLRIIEIDRNDGKCNSD